MQVLCLLVERRGEVVTRDEVRNLLWPANLVIDADDGLSTAIRKIRVALGDQAGKPQYVETVPKRGYRFIAPVSAPEPPAQTNGISKAATDSSSVLPPHQTHWRNRTLAAVAVGVAILGAGWWRAASGPGPTVLHTVRLTEDGAFKGGPLTTDGVRLYFLEAGVSMQMAVTGGTPVPFLPRGVLAISPAGDQALVSGGPSGTAPEQPLYDVRLPAGTETVLGVEGHSGVWSPDGKRVAYANGSDLFLTALDGGAPKRLVKAPGRIEMPGWSPDGSLIRFVVVGADDTYARWDVSARDGRVLEVDPRREPWSQADCAGNWTADGRYYIFGRSAHGAIDLWAAREGRDWVGRRTRKEFRITDGAISFYSPVLSRDGTKVFAIGAVSRGDLMLYQAGTRQFSPYLTGLSASNLTYSPDGTRMLWISIPGRSLWRSRADGGERIQLTFDSLEDVETPSWSPDQKSVVFAARRAARPGNLRLYRMPASGGSAEELLPGNYDQANPNWSRDGNSVVFGGAPWLHEFAPGTSAIRRVDLRSHTVTVLPGSEGLWAPKLSPDGRFVAAETLDSRTLELFDLQTGTWSRLISMQGVIGYPCWSHDGTAIYFNILEGNPGGPAVYRVDRIAKKLTRVVDLHGFKLTGALSEWFGLRPDDSLLFLRDASIQDIFAFDVRFP